jgi:hypothetical protein
MIEPGSLSRLYTDPIKNWRTRFSSSETYCAASRLDIASGWTQSTAGYRDSDRGDQNPSIDHRKNAGRGTTKARYSPRDGKTKTWDKAQKAPAA